MADPIGSISASEVLHRRAATAGAVSLSAGAFALIAFAMTVADSSDADRVELSWMLLVTAAVAIIAMVAGATAFILSSLARATEAATSVADADPHQM